MTDLSELIEELQDINKATRDVNDKLLTASGWEINYSAHIAIAPDGDAWSGPNFDSRPEPGNNVQAALDYAVPDGWRPCSINWIDRGVGCYLRRGPITTGGLDDPNIRYGKGATPALAVSAAALKAREAGG